MRTKILVVILAIFSSVAIAKEIKTLTVSTDPVMHCQGCEKKIKDYFRFEKGVKDIKTSVPEQLVIITYDADKTTESHLLEGFHKIDYTVTVVEANDSI